MVVGEGNAVEGDDGAIGHSDGCHRGGSGGIAVAKGSFDNGFSAQTVAVEEAAAAEEKEKKTPPEVEPLPPKKEFQYGDDLTLD